MRYVAGLRTHITLPTTGRLKATLTQGRALPIYRNMASSSKVENVEGEKPFRNREDPQRSPTLANLRQQIETHQKSLLPLVQSKFANVSESWNKFSGYEEVIAGKERVEEAERNLKDVREAQKVARTAYKEAVSQRSNSQRRINDLLQRKTSWTDEDLSVYTQLLRSEHSEARAEREAGEIYDDVERRVGHAWDDVQRKTLERYHAEQVWSDRVRAASTYASLAVAGINVLVFFLAIVLVEPYKRKRLAQTFEERILRVEERNAEELSMLVDRFEHRLGSVDEKMSKTHDSVGLLLVKAGIIDSGNVEVVEGQVEEQSQPGTMQNGRGQRVNEEKRKDLFLAGGLGFAIGAGILAAMGAVWS